MATLAKDFHRLLKRIDKLSDHQARVGDVNWDEDTLEKFTVVLQPNSGYYAGGNFKFTITIPDAYPSETPPTVWCHTEIYHPNIDPTDEWYEDTSTNVCCNIFDRGTWNPKFGLEGVVLGLIFLMHNPNYDDPLSPYFEPCPDEAEFTENVRRYMAGLDVDGHTFNVDFAVPYKDNSDASYEQEEQIIVEAEVIVEADVKGEVLDTQANDIANGSLNENTENVTETSEVNELTEEYMLKLLCERDDAIYTELINKCVTEISETVTNIVQNPMRGVGNNLSDIEDEEEDVIDLVFVDGDYMIVQRDCNHVLDELATEAISNGAENTNDMATSILVTEDTAVHTVLPEEEYMLQVLHEREIRMYTEYIDKSVAEVNEIRGQPNVIGEESEERNTETHIGHIDVVNEPETKLNEREIDNEILENDLGDKKNIPDDDITCNINNKEKQASDLYTLYEMNGASSRDGNVSESSDDSVHRSQTRDLSKLVQRSFSAPQGLSGDIDKGHHNAGRQNTGTLIDASLKAFTFFIQMYTTWH